MNDEDLMENLMQMCDQVIYVEEVDSDDAYMQTVFKRAVEHRDALMLQFDTNLGNCKDEESRLYVKEVMLNFLIFSLKTLIAKYDCPDDNIVWLADHLKAQILQLKRIK